MARKAERETSSLAALLESLGPRAGAALRAPPPTTRGGRRRRRRRGRRGRREERRRRRVRCGRRGGGARGARGRRPGGGWRAGSGRDGVPTAGDEEPSSTRLRRCLPADLGGVAVRLGPVQSIARAFVLVAPLALSLAPLLLQALLLRARLLLGSAYPGLPLFAGATTAAHLRRLTPLGAGETPSSSSSLLRAPRRPLPIAKVRSASKCACSRREDGGCARVLFDRDVRAHVIGCAFQPISRCFIDCWSILIRFNALHQYLPIIPP